MTQQESDCSTWLNLFVNFFKLETPIELKIVKENNDPRQWTIETNNPQLNNHPFVKAQKWAVRCIERFFELYGRPPHVDCNQVKVAQNFMLKYSRTFLELIYFNVLCKYSQQQEFVYFKTLQACFGYVGLACHFGQLFEFLCEKSGEYLNDLIFNCLFKIICFTPNELTMIENDGRQYILSNCMLCYALCLCFFFSSFVQG